MCREFSVSLEVGRVVPVLAAVLMFVVSSFGPYPLPRLRPLCRYKQEMDVWRRAERCCVDVTRLCIEALEHSLQFLSAYHYEPFASLTRHFGRHGRAEGRLGRKVAISIDRDPAADSR